MIPAKIGRYEVKSELGRGGMATVYRAYDPSFDREVAIKVLPSEYLHDPNFHDRFKREIKIIAALEHPAIVPVHDVGEDNGIPYFVMRYMPGGSLTNQIEKGNFSMVDAAKIIEKLASALAYAHNKGIVHRDLKPDNILFDINGDPFISDFGVASFATGPADLTGNSAIGTPAYMSPEQAQGDKVDSRSDIYGLGVIIFQMLSGQQPYKADTPMGVAVKQIMDPVPEILKANPGLPRDTDTIIKTAMAKNKDDRYNTTTELADAFQKVASGDEYVVSARQSSERISRPITSNSESAKPSSKNRGLVFAGIGIFGLFAILAIAALLAGLFFFKDKIFASKPEPTIVAATEATTATEAPLPDPEFFTEDFNESLDKWDYFYVGGLESQVKSTVEDGFLNSEISGKNQRYYMYYMPKTYKNVRIDVHTENRGNTVNIVTMICRYDENKGWYEFNVNSGGLYQILYTSWNTDKKNTSFKIIANGGSTAIRLGAEANDYSVICNDRNLSLSINGQEVGSVVDNNFLLGEGYVGIGMGSEKFVPSINRIDSISISQP